MRREQNVTSKTVGWKMSQWYGGKVLLFLMALLFSAVISGMGSTLITQAAELTGSGYKFDTETGQITVTSTSFDIATATQAGTFDKTDVRTAIIQTGGGTMQSGILLGCTNLTSVTVMPGETEIGESAFQDCSSLTSVTLPTSVTKFNSDAFKKCSSLTNIEIPSSLNNLGTGTFEGCSSLTSIEIPSGVATLGGNVFKNCSGLTSVTMNTGLSIIGVNVFDGCNSLTSITIPSGVLTIGTSAFANCTKLASITVPQSVSVFSVQAFTGCTALTSATMGGETISVKTLMNYFGTVYITPISQTNFLIYATENPGFTFDKWSGGTVGSKNAANTNYTRTPGNGNITLTAGMIQDVDTVILKINKDGDDYESHGKTFTLYSGGSLVYTGTCYDGGTCVFTDVAEGTYNVFDDNSDTGIPVVKQTDVLFNMLGLNYYTVKFAAEKVGTAASAKITGKYNNASITSGAVVLSGKKLELTASGSGADSYTYGWSGTGTNAERTAVFTIDSLSKAIDVTCTVTGKNGNLNATVTKVAVSPTSASILKGGTKTFSAKVTGTGSPSQEVIWSVSGNKSKNTKITTVGKLTVGSDETATTVTIKAVSKDDTKKFGTAKVSVAPKKGANFTAGNFTYKITNEKTNGSGTVTMTGVAKGKTVTTLTVPATTKYNGITYKVTAIGEKAFNQNKKIQKATIGNNVVTIGKNAFRECTKLTTVTVGNKVTTISNAAFIKCSALKKVTIGTGLKKLENHAFCLDHKLATVTIKSTKLTSVGNHALNEVSNLKIKVPASKVNTYKKLFAKTEKGKNVKIMVM